jgi:hypothetical protein
MKKLLLLTVGLIVIVSPAAAQDPNAGIIELYADAGGTSCVVYDIAPSLITVYVFHMGTPGATACQFRVVQTGGAFLTYLGEISPYTSVIGNSQTGISIAYGYCVPSPNLILTINYFGSGISALCSLIEVMPDPAAILPNEILVADCGSPPNLLIGAGRGIWVNPDGINCSGDCDDIPLPSQQTSWGQLKGLYR